MGGGSSAPRRGGRPSSASPAPGTGASPAAALPSAALEGEGDPAGARHWAGDRAGGAHRAAEVLTVTREGGKIGISMEHVRITGVVPGGPADVAGLRRGMLLRAVNGEEVRTFADVARCFAAAPDTFTVEVGAPTTPSSSISGATAEQVLPSGGGAARRTDPDAFRTLSPASPDAVVASATSALQPRAPPGRAPPYYLRQHQYGAPGAGAGDADARRPDASTITSAIIAGISAARTQLLQRPVVGGQGLTEDLMHSLTDLTLSDSASSSLRHPGRGRVEPGQGTPERPGSTAGRSRGRSTSPLSAHSPATELLTAGSTTPTTLVSDAGTYGAIGGPPSHGTPQSRFQSRSQSRSQGRSTSVLSRSRQSVPSPKEMKNSLVLARWLKTASVDWEEVKELYRCLNEQQILSALAGTPLAAQAAELRSKLAPAAAAAGYFSTPYFSISAPSTGDLQSAPAPPAARSAAAAPAGAGAGEAPPRLQRDATAANAASRRAHSPATTAATSTPRSNETDSSRQNVPVMAALLQCGNPEVCFWIEYLASAADIAAAPPADAAATDIDVEMAVPACLSSPSGAPDDEASSRLAGCIARYDAVVKDVFATMSKPLSVYDAHVQRETGGEATIKVFIRDEWSVPKKILFAVTYVKQYGARHCSRTPAAGSQRRPPIRFMIMDPGDMENQSGKLAERTGICWSAQGPTPY